MITEISPLVYIILLVWNNSSDTIACIESLFKIKYKNWKIILVDNASTNDAIQEIHQWAKHKSVDHLIHFILLQENLGFSGGNNAGMEYAIKNNADYVLLLNNDTIVTDDFLNHLIATAQKIKDVGLLGCKIKYFTETSKVWFSGGYINFLKGCGSHYEDDYNDDRECDFITGCLMLIPSQVLKHVGLFDDRYFLLSEDTDLSYRIKKAGYRLVTTNKVVIYHKISTAIGGRYSKRNQYYFHRNRMLFFKKFLWGYQKCLFYCLQFLLIIPAWIVVEVFKGNGKAIKWALLGYRDFILGKFGKCPYL